MGETMILIKDFRKSYGGFIAVDGITLDVSRGEVFGLLGPNGAGKTTTLECLEGLRRSDGGTLRVADVDPGRVGRRLSRLIGVQLQASALPDSIRVDEAMRFFCPYHKIAPRFDLIERVGLTEKRHAQYHELSGGQQRRLALALAVAHRPAVLILDEPTSGLDVGSRVMLHDLIRELQSDGTTILLATHDMAEASELASRVAILLRGRIAAIGTPMELTATGGGLTRISVRTEGDCLSLPDAVFPAVQHTQNRDAYEIYFSTDVGRTVSALISFITDRKDVLIDLRVERPSLEERFLEITTEQTSP
ncbi:ABC transporter ATP-binding protein [Cryobacterium serini]|uniref:ABC transporter ATP-binding protein n=1 Tax=Cryobacterium serini TaxID=1259201 RepID=A0A4R9BSP0_9MICO|nr:ABC transporter ATP-binding protein [Cryobacterium serini]TFD90094.1 ABC transporter ATP-binding protein [Cryobacterium serini]